MGFCIMILISPYALALALERIVENEDVMACVMRRLDNQTSNYIALNVT